LTSDYDLKRKPAWLKIGLPKGSNFLTVQKTIRDENLNTVCQSARCPNLAECWSRRTAAFLILGDRCTRNCGFCAVRSDSPHPPDPGEPKRIARAVQAMNLGYVVVTSVTRDDLSDGGASHFAQTIREIKTLKSDIRVEVLIPDFAGNRTALDSVLAAAPDILNHNLETVPRLYSLVRPQADYSLSLTVLRRAAANGFTTKSGIMVGLGEKAEEVLATMRDLLQTGCSMLTIGQYLQPSRQHLPVSRFVLPEEFDRLRDDGLAMGFDYIEAGPLVRSSYYAEEQVGACQ
jgi:lipoic acid synthetase